MAMQQQEKDEKTMAVVDVQLVVKGTAKRESAHNADTSKRQCQWFSSNRVSQTKSLEKLAESLPRVIASPFPGCPAADQERKHPLASDHTRRGGNRLVSEFEKRLARKPDRGSPAQRESEKRQEVIARSSYSSSGPTSSSID